MTKPSVLLVWGALMALIVTVNAPTLDYGIAYDDVAVWERYLEETPEDLEARSRPKPYRA